MKGILLSRSGQVFLLALAALAGCKNQQKQAGPPPNTAPASLNVISVQPQKITLHTDYPATLQGQEVIEIRPKIEGYLEEQYVDEGARVRKGQKLFRISSPQYEQELRSAQAGILTAEADVSAAQMTVNKTKPLVESEIISKYELESAEYTLAAKKAALAQANATLANARANIGYTMITSPANGFIGTIPYKKGSLVSGSSASALTTLSADKNIYAYFSFNEKQLLDFNRNFKGKTTSEMLSKLPAIQLILADGTVYLHEGKLETVSGLLTTATGTATFRAGFPNTESLLKSGGSASVRIPRNIDSALVIPQGATYELQDKRLVYLVDNNNRVFSRAITALPTNDGQSFVVTDGLSKGDKIVTNGISSLKDSLLIQPIMAK